jgi:hypothetical protein
MKTLFRSGDQISELPRGRHPQKGTSFEEQTGGQNYAGANLVIHYVRSTDRSQFENTEMNTQSTKPKSSVPHVSAVQEISAKIDCESSLTEDKIKTAVKEWLKADNWTVKTAMGKAHGIDVDATKKSGERWIIEVKGPGSRAPMRVNYFISILGETLQRMNDPQARYSICFPRLQQYERLWSRLPDLAKERTGISIIFVSPDGTIQELRN